jgi:hypothetical protein
MGGNAGSLRNVEDTKNVGGVPEGRKTPPYPYTGSTYNEARKVRIAGMAILAWVKNAVWLPPSIT